LYVGLKDDTENLIEIGGMHFENDDISSKLFEDEEDEKDVKKTYQIQKKYIVYPIKSGMIIIDQQRAHQRILYEQLLVSMTVEHAPSQQLLFPMLMHFSKNDLPIVEDLKLSLSNTGFQFEANQDNHIVITGLPTNVSDAEVASIFDQLLADLQNGIAGNSFSQNDTIAKSMAKSLAVKTGMRLTEKEQENIVNGLFACKEPNVSPFQKPTFITMSVEDLDKKFTL